MGKWKLGQSVKQGSEQGLQHTACAKAQWKGSSSGKQVTVTQTWVFHLILVRICDPGWHKLTAVLLLSSGGPCNSLDRRMWWK